MPAWLDRLIYRRILGKRTDQLLAILRTAYENNEDPPTEAQAVIDERIAAYQPPSPPEA